MVFCTVTTIQKIGMAIITVIYRIVRTVTAFINRIGTTAMTVIHTILGAQEICT